MHGGLFDLETQIWITPSEQLGVREGKVKCPGKIEISLRVPLGPLYAIQRSGLPWVAGWSAYERLNP